MSVQTSDPRMCEVNTLRFIRITIADQKHRICDRSLFVTLQETDETIEEVVFGVSRKAHGEGTVSLILPTDNGLRSLTLEGCLYDPEAGYGMLSAKRMLAAGYRIDGGFNSMMFPDGACYEFDVDEDNLPVLKPVPAMPVDGTVLTSTEKECESLPAPAEEGKSYVTSGAVNSAEANDVIQTCPAPKTSRRQRKKALRDQCDQLTLDIKPAVSDTPSSQPSLHHGVFTARGERDKRESERLWDKVQQGAAQTSSQEGCDTAEGETSEATRSVPATKIRDELVKQDLIPVGWPPPPLCTCNRELQTTLDKMAAELRELRLCYTELHELQDATSWRWTKQVLLAVASGLLLSKLYTTTWR